MTTKRARASSTGLKCPYYNVENYLFKHRRKIFSVFYSNFETLHGKFIKLGKIQEINFAFKLSNELSSTLIILLGF